MIYRCHQTEPRWSTKPAQASTPRGAPGWLQGSSRVARPPLPGFPGSRAAGSDAGSHGQCRRASRSRLEWLSNERRLLRAFRHHKSSPYSWFLFRGSRNRNQTGGLGESRRRHVCRQVTCILRIWSRPWGRQASSPSRHSCLSVRVPEVTSGNEQTPPRAYPGPTLERLPWTYPGPGTQRLSLPHSRAGSLGPGSAVGSALGKMDHP